MNSKILIVDDEPEIRSSLKRYLDMTGAYQVIAVEDAAKAMEVYRLEMPEVILADIDMPGRSGIDLLTDVRQHFPAIQVILMTGKTTLDRALDGLSAGAVDYLLKPLDMVLMDQIVAESVQRYHRWHSVVRANLMDKKKKAA